MDTMKRSIEGHKIGKRPRRKNDKTVYNNSMKLPGKWPALDRFYPVMPKNYHERRWRIHWQTPFSHHVSMNSLCILLIGSSLYLILTRYRQSPKPFTLKLKRFTTHFKLFTGLLQAFYSFKPKCFTVSPNFPSFFTWALFTDAALKPSSTNSWKCVIFLINSNSISFGECTVALLSTVMCEKELKVCLLANDS